MLRLSLVKKKAPKKATKKKESGWFQTICMEASRSYTKETVPLGHERSKTESQQTRSVSTIFLLFVIGEKNKNPVLT